jgi:hypothetical protein
MMRYKFQIPSTKPQTNFQVSILKVGMQIFEPSEFEFPWKLGLFFGISAVNRRRRYQIFARWSAARIIGEPSGISKAF